MAYRDPFGTPAQTPVGPEHSNPDLNNYFSGGIPVRVVFPSCGQTS
jgi:hypothetical protein